MANYTKEDITNVAIGGALLASGGGGSFTDTLSILNDVPSDYQANVVNLNDIDLNDSHAVIAFIGSPTAGEGVNLDDVTRALKNTVDQLTKATGYPSGIQGYTPIEIGAINTVVPLLVPLATGNQNLYIIDGDGAGRSVPKIEQSTYAGVIPPSPVVLANYQSGADAIAVDLMVPNVDDAENLARSVVSGESFGGFSGIGLFPELNSTNLTKVLLILTIGRTKDLGAYMAGAKRSTSDIINYVSSSMMREASLIVQGTLQSVTETTSGGFDIGQVVIKDNGTSGDIYTIYNLNENLIMFSSGSSSPVVAAPDSICYYSEDTGRSFSNSSDDITPYLNKTISVIKIAAIPDFANDQEIINSFRTTLQSIGYAGKFPIG